MSRIADIIPIDSRRPLAARRLVPPPPSEPDELAEHTARTRGRAVLASIMAVCVLGVLFLVTQEHLQHSVARLPPSHREAIVRRAEADLLETCTLPEAGAGPLREHCLEEANLVLLFPECDDACVRRAREILPHARR